MPEIPAYPALSAARSDDQLVILDVHDTTASSQGTVKKIAVSALDAAAGADWVNVVALGADPTGSAACDSIVNTAISGLGSQGGVIYFPTGTYKVSSGITATLAAAQTVTIAGDGASATILKYYGSGDAVRMYNSSAAGSGGAESYFSGVRDLTVDGTNGTGSPVGLHAGDITFLQLDGLLIQNFTGTSSIGLHLDNTVTYTEEGDYRVAVSNCTSGVILEVTTGYNSFGYSNFDLTFFAAGAQSLLTILNGALLYHSAVRMRGDVNGSATALSGNPAVIVVKGAGPGGSQASGDSPAITSSHLDVLVEPNNLSGTATNFMSTFYLDTTNFGYVNECYGLLDFSQGTGSFAPISTTMLAGNNSNFTQFSGIIAGDSNLNPSGVLGWNMWGSGTIANYLPGYTNYDGYFPTYFADVFSTTLDGSDATFSLNFSGVGNGDTLAGPQRKLMFIRQPSSGGPYTLNFVVAGSATNASPTITWAGGSAPRLSTVPNGVDVIEVVSWDGATWYGHHLASYGTATGQTVTLRPEAQRVTLTTAFTSASSAAAQNVTDMSAYLPAGSYKLAGWFPMTQSAGTGTEKLGFTFSGTATGLVRWTLTGASTATSSVTALTTASGVSPALSSSGLFGECTAEVTVTAAGMLQLQATASATGTEVIFPVGCHIDVEPLA